MRVHLSNPNASTARDLLLLSALLHAELARYAAHASACAGEAVSYVLRVQTNVTNIAPTGRGGSPRFTLGGYWSDRNAEHEIFQVGSETAMEAMRELEAFHVGKGWGLPDGPSSFDLVWHDVMLHNFSPQLVPAGDLKEQNANVARSQTTKGKS